MYEKLKKRLDIITSGINNIDLIPIKVSQEVHDYRWDICSGCEKLWKPTSSCKVCGCFMKVKTWMPNQACPIGKWPAAKVDDNNDDGAG